MTAIRADLDSKMCLKTVFMTLTVLGAVQALSFAVQLAKTFYDSAQVRLQTGLATHYAMYCSD